MNNKFTQIVMFFVIFLFFSCASVTSNKNIEISTSHQNVVSKLQKTIKIKERIPKFSIKPVDIRNFGICLGPDGQDKYYINANTSLHFIAKFEKPIFLNKSLRLVFEGKSFPLMRSTVQSFITEKISLSFLKKGIYRHPLPIKIYIDDNLIGEYKLNSVIIDTIPPSTPKLEVQACLCKSFVLNWYPVDKDAVYLIQNLNKNAHWLTIKSVKNPPVEIDNNGIPKGRWRVVAMDCAKNKAVSNEIELTYICQRLYPKFNGDIRVSSFDKNSFTINWSIRNYGNIPVRFIIEKLENQQWKHVIETKSTSASIGSPPFEGNYRVVMYYCDSRMEAKDFSPAIIDITEKGCGGTCEKAYNNALYEKIYSYFGELIGEKHFSIDISQKRREFVIHLEGHMCPINYEKLGCRCYNGICKAKVRAFVRTQELLDFRKNNHNPNTF